MKSPAVVKESTLEEESTNSVEENKVVEKEKLLPPVEEGKVLPLVEEGVSNVQKTTTLDKNTFVEKIILQEKNALIVLAEENSFQKENELREENISSAGNVLGILVFFIFSNF